MTQNMDTAKEDKKQRRNQLLARWLARYIRFVFKTSKRNSDYLALKESFDEHAPVIIAGWHGTFLLSPILMPNPTKVSAVVARHGDAELMGLMLSEFGVNIIRGAGAGGKKKDKGGAFALRMALRELKAGRSIGMTADVPPGPARRVGPGMIVLARLSGRPILPVAAVTSRFTVLNSWSRFVVNLPFSKLALLAGEPILVPKGASAEVMEEKRQLLEQSIEELVTRGHHMVGADPDKADVPRVGRPAKAGLMLKTYGGVMNLARPVAPYWLDRRVAKGKEEVERLDERYGIAGLARPEGPLIWIHAASVGETNAVMPLINALKQKYPAHIILLTTGTRTSAKIAADRLPEGAIHQFIPLDAPAFVQRFMDHWQPDLVILVESEIWPNMILQVAARKLPLVLVNAIMSVKSFKNWRRRPRLSRPLFGSFHLVLTQNISMKERFLRLGAPEVEEVGNLKFDAPALSLDAEKSRQLAQIIGKRPLWLAASTHKGEEEQILSAHEKLRETIPDILTIIVPRHPERGGEIGKLLAAQGIRFAQRSKGEEPGPQNEVYLADTLGEIALFYDLADLVFMGASLVAGGGHNPVEAVRFDAAILTGPNWHNQGDSFAALLKGGGAFEIASGEELGQRVAELLGDKERLQLAVGKARGIVGEMSGAVARTMQALGQGLINRADNDARNSTKQAANATKPESNSDNAA